MNRKAIVLLATIMLLIFISILVGFSLKIVDRSILKVKEVENYTQTGIILKNLKNIIGHYASKINNAEECDMIFGMPIAIESKEHNVNLYMKFQPTATGINPNLLLDFNQTENIAVRDIFLRIFEAYKIKNPAQLLAFIEDSIDTDLADRAGNSEIALNSDYYFKQGRIEDMDQWYKILTHYASIARDHIVLEMPWEELISFSNNKIDFNYVSPFLLRQIFPKIDEASASNMTHKKNALYKSYSEIGIDGYVAQAEFEKYFMLFNKTAPYNVQCDISYNAKGSEDKIRVFYDITSKKYGDVQKLY